MIGAHIAGLAAGGSSVLAAVDGSAAAGGHSPAVAHALSALLIGLAALALAPARGDTARRRALRGSHLPRPSRASSGRLDAVRAAAGLAGLCAFVVVGGLAGALTGVAFAVALDIGLRRLEPRARRRERAAVRADLPLAVDLLAAVLAAGAPIATAADQVGAAVGGPLGERLRQVAAVLLLGAPPDEAWLVLGGVPEAAPLARAAIRAADSGAALAGASTRLATELRAGQHSAALARSRRAEVLVVLPLGCCFLPAFVLVGVVPVVLGVLDDVLV